MWGCILSLVNQILRFPLTSEYDDTPNAVAGAGSTCMVIGTGKDQVVNSG
ncbi:MAG: hypothetical protein K8R08_09830 [Methanosarcinales archaeon]|nr:hypothetical protein [Methanosarcinales archaeon]